MEAVSAVVDDLRETIMTTVGLMTESVDTGSMNEGGTCDTLSVGNAELVAAVVEDLGAGVSVHMRSMRWTSSAVPSRGYDFGREAAFRRADVRELGITGFLEAAESTARGSDGFFI
jgi:hypothetical protein